MTQEFGKCLKLWNQETKKPSNQETKKPRSQESQETKKPRNFETKKDTKKPRNQEPPTPQHTDSHPCTRPPCTFVLCWGCLGSVHKETRRAERSGFEIVWSRETSETQHCFSICGISTSSPFFLVLAKTMVKLSTMKTRCNIGEYM